MGLLEIKMARGRRGARAALLVVILAASYRGASSDGGDSLPAADVRLAPWFVEEPPARAVFAAAAGARLPCAARGDPPPALAWLDHDMRELLSDHTRRVYGNGTLEIAPVPAGAVARAGGAGASAGGAGGVLRCRAANLHGIALSAPVTLLPVADDSWEAEVTAWPAAAGGVAALTCGAAGGAGEGEDGDELEPALWYHGDRVLDVPPPSPEARYLSAGNALLIRGVSERDAGAYDCLARHRASRRTRRARPAHLSVTQGATGAAPAPAAAALTVRAAAGATACLPCAASTHPAPHYTWYRERSGRLQPVGGADADDTWAWGGGAALCVRRAARAQAGAWLCKAYSALGDATARLHLIVDLPLTVTLQPSLVVVAPGSTVRLNCSTSDPEAALSWRHDGAPVGGAGAGAGGAAGAGSLVLRAVSRAARGVYQCEARRGARAAQASAELRLGESAPELQYTFIEQALRPGGDVALRCAAAAAPPPRVAWLLDAQPLAHYRAPHRYTITEEAGPGGEVVSTLRLRALAAADGGRYTCRAHNARGAAEHSARLNVYGPPSIRAAGPVRVVAGANATIYCPYAGYPISEVVWWRGGARVGGAGRVSARGAALRLRPSLSQDHGAYACSVAAPDQQTARQEIEIQVRNPPKISPFMFSSELSEGSSAQALCGVSSGDKPLYFSWLKDGAPLPPVLQVQEKSLGEFSLLVFPALGAQHSGAYTCRVANHAAAANYTATLSVKVAPVWMTEPSDAAVLLGAPLLLECAARGHPTPVVTWYRKVGESPNNLESEEQWEEMVNGEWGGEAGAAAARGGVLSAAAAARRHQGRYRCRADNGVGAPLLKHVNVTVHEPAHFEATEPRNVSSVRGQDVVLWCRARGDAPLTLTWMRLDRRLDLDSFRWSVSESGGGGVGSALRSELRLRAAERADAGEYRCLAANHFGRAELPLYLHVQEPPGAPAGLRLGGVGARWVRLVWVAGAGAERYLVQFAPLHAPPGAAPATANLTLEPPGAVAGEVAATLAGLRPAAAYSLRARAANHVGLSPPSAPLLFTTLEEAPSSAPQDVRVRAVAPGELLVTWTAPPRDSWNGELLGFAASWRALSGSDEDEDAGAGEEGDPRRAGAAAAAGWARAELTLPGLRRAARYAVTLRAYNRAGAGPPAPPIYASTADGVPGEPPGGVRCVPEAAALRVWWTPPPAPPAPPPAALVVGYDVHYAPVYDSPAWSGPAGGGVAAALAGATSATLRALRAATNYSVRVRARSSAGPGPASVPAYCTTLDDVPEAVRAVRALPAGAGAVRVAWLAPPRSRPTHYTLYTKERDKMGGEWSQRVEAEDEEEAGAGAGEQGEAWHEVRGLRERVVYEFWVRAHSPAGAGEPGRVAAATPSKDAPVRILSWARTVRVVRGTRVRLRCATAGGGAGPVRRRWAPLPRRHSLTAAGDLLIHELEAESAGNYTCAVAGADGSRDAAAWRVELRAPPAAPHAPRLVRAAPHALLLAWDAPALHLEQDPIIGFTVWWTREGVSEPGAARSARVPARGAGAGSYSHALAGLACGARHRVWLRAHSAAGASPPSAALRAATPGRQAPAPPGSAFIWANSTTLRLNLLVWRAGDEGDAGEPPCPITRWSVALRPAAGGGWSALADDGDTAEAGGLVPGAWYEVRVAAHGAAGVTRARYRAATRAHSGERIGEPIELAVEEGAVPAGAEGAARSWRGGLAPALAGGALAALLGAGAAALVRARRTAAAPPAPLAPPPHPQLYTTEPGKRNGKTLTPPNGGELEEISPYATFSMGEAARGCALHLHTFGRASPPALAAPPARPNLLHHAPELCRGCDSDSESSGSPCAACADLYREPAAPAPRRAPRPPTESPCGVESSAEDTSYSARGARGERGARAPRGRRRRDHAPAARSGAARARSGGGAPRDAL